MLTTNGRNGWATALLAWLASAQVPVDGILSESRERFAPRPLTAPAVPARRRAA